jgi:hypothetical protein
MTPEDKALTENAARAAGKEVLGWIGDQIHTRDRPGVAPDIGQFDPLNDDGDALRLATRLRLSLSMYNEGVTTRHFSQVTRTLGSELGREDVATRRAIVTAAAAMWLAHVDEMDRVDIETQEAG